MVEQEKGSPELSLAWLTCASFFSVCALCGPGTYSDSAGRSVCVTCKPPQLASPLFGSTFGLSRRTWNVFDSQWHNELFCLLCSSADMRRRPSVRQHRLLVSALIRAPMSGLCVCRAWVNENGEVQGVQCPAGFCETGGCASGRDLSPSNVLCGSCLPGYRCGFQSITHYCRLVFTLAVSGAPACRATQ